MHKTELPRWAFPSRLDLIGAAVLLAATALWVVLRPGIAKSVIGSSQALLIVGAAGVLSVLLGLGIWRLTRRGLLARALALVPLLAIFLWSEVLPQFKGETVSADADPLAAVSTEAPTSSTAAAPSSTAAAPTSSAPTSNAPTSAAQPTTTASAAPVLIGEGLIAGIDHQAGGTARLIRNADGTYVVRFENFSVEPGPSYVLHLVPGADAQTPQRGINLGAFNTTQGAVNVAVPGQPVIDGPVTVLIWCDVYAVPVANATING